MTRERLCLTCQTVGIPKTATRGSIWIELVLWLCFLIPGLIYSIWRITGKTRVCRACGSQQLVPLTSPAARKVLA